MNITRREMQNLDFLNNKPILSVYSGFFSVGARNVHTDIVEQMNDFGRCFKCPYYQHHAKDFKDRFGGFFHVWVMVSLKLINKLCDFFANAKRIILHISTAYPPKQ